MNKTRANFAFTYLITKIKLTYVIILVNIKIYLLNYEKLKKVQL